MPPPSPALQTAPTVQVVIDYSLDANHFFDTQQKRDLLQQAADSVARWFSDSLLPITPSGSDSWDATFDNPATGQQQTVSNRSIAADQVLLFAGGRDMPDALGRGGPGGYQARGTVAWRDRVAMRGQSGSPGSPEFGPWGGAITFDTNPASPWFFGQTTSSGLNGANDFLSVATHEVTHLFGFGTSDAWNGFVDATAHTFSGPASVALYDGVGRVPLSDDDSHWANGVTDEGQETAMDPLITVGERHLLTPLDRAGLDDIGWSMPPRVTSVLAGGVTSPGTAPQQISVTYSHYAAIDSSTLDAADVTVLAPNGTITLPATLVSTASSGDGTSRTVTYAVAPPGGAWDAADNGVYSVVLRADQVRSTTGEAVAAGTLGSFVADIADAPAGVLQPAAAPTPGSPSETLVVVYTDGVAVDPASIDAADITVTAPDGSALAVAGAAADSAAPGTPRIATYTVAAPGGTWGPEDDGVYTVTLRAGQVRDTSGNVAAADAVIGTLDVSLGSVAFDAHQPAVYTDASGDVVKVTLKGPGSGRVRFGDVRPADAVAIELDGTTAGSTLSVKTGPAGTSVSGISINGSLKSLAGKTLDLAGNVASTGTLGALRLRTAAGGAVSAASIGSIAAGAWNESVSTAGSLGRMKVFSLTGNVSAAGGIGSVSARSITGAHLFAGVRPDLSGDLPAALSDFSNPNATIRSVVSKEFSGSFVAAPTVGKLTLGVAAGGAAADRFFSVSGRPSLTDPPFKVRNLDAPGSGPVLSGFEIRVL